MRLLIQRVTEGRCRIDGKVHSEIGQGLVGLVGIGNDETREVMIVSQFTLHAMTKKGNRPSWIKAAPEAISKPIYEEFVASVEASIGKSVATGVFGADMKIELTNDGPVTIWIDSKNRE